VAGDPASGELAALIAELSGRGFTIGGDRLKTRPRGVPADHPRLELLRHRTLDIGRGFPPDLVHDGSAPTRVAETWRAVLPVLRWVSEHIRSRPL
jgi:hypothetical protein